MTSPWQTRTSPRTAPAAGTKKSRGLRADAKCGLIRILGNLQVAECLPASILLGLFRSWIFVALQPEAEPFDISGLSCQALSRIRHHVAARLQHDHIHWFLEIAQRRIRLP